MSRRPDTAVDSIAASAAGAVDLETVAAAIRGCTACADLARERRNVVVGEFPPHARLLLVGEAPGAQEDESGRPFVGKAGQLLDRLLAEAGLHRTQVAVANVLKCRPPSNRQPAAAEVARCRGWLDRQVALVDPELVVTLGGTALAWALGPRLRLRDAREHVHEWRGRHLIATYHPSAAIRFGPAGAPIAALRADLRRAAEVLCAS